MDDYIAKIAIPQVREILTNYGDVAELWWDTPEGMNRERAAQLAELLKLQPKIIVNDRLGGGLPGDFTTPEQYIPSTGLPGRDWETCMTINDTWGYKSYDNNWKSTETLVRNLIDIASKGGNYLLNVGPTADGVFPEPILQRLKEVGQWMKANGEAVYGTSASPFTKQLAWGRCTRKGEKLYLNVFDWPSNGLLRVPLVNDVKKAYLLAEPKKALRYAKLENAIEITVPEKAPDKISSVIVLEIKGEPEPAAASITKANPGEPVLLTADYAKIVGASLQVETKGGKSNLGYWTNLADYAQWRIEFAEAGAYDVVLEYALAPDSKGSKVSLECNASKAEFAPEATKGWDDYVQAKAGVIKVEKGSCNLVLKGVEKPGLAVMNLREIKLTPINIE
jgi:alpha-L-fucosidase